KAAAVALVANTAPVAFGAIAVPITTLGKITGIDPDLLGAMVGRQTPILAVFVPFILVLMVDGVRGLRQVWPAALVGGASFAVAQFVTANFIAYEVADIVAAMVGAVALMVLLRVWQPASISARDQAEIRDLISVGGGGASGPTGAHEVPAPGRRSALLAFSPYLIIVVLFALTSFGPLKTFLDTHSGWKFGWPGLDVVNSAGKPLSAATFNFNLWTAGGTVLLVAALITALLLRVKPREALATLGGLVVKFRWTVVTVTAVLALAYVMNFSGQTVTLGLALAATGGFFAFLSPVVGWIGVAVTGSDTSANSLFGLLQVTAAQRTGISPILLAAANTSGGVVGKMVSPQNLAIAAAVVGLEGRESDLLRSVAKWTGILLLGVCVLVYLQSTPVLGWMVVA
ncbi:MAG: L-lactate permease, partial [Nakamurella sp.]